MRRAILVVSNVITLLSLVACGTNSASSQINLVCASVEGYQSTKAMALVDSAEGRSAVSFIDGVLAPLSEGIAEDKKATELFSYFLRSMNTWAQIVDEYQLARNPSNLNVAASKLETNIDSLVVQCEKSGWKFQPGWR